MDKWRDFQMERILISTTKISLLIKKKKKKKNYKNIMFISYLCLDCAGALDGAHCLNGLKAHVLMKVE
jgi:hypothetical protein